MAETLKTLANGLRVMLVPCEAESVAIGLFVASGSRHETAKTAGISHFIEHMLFKGTATRTPFDLTREIEGRGGMVNACTGEESTCFYCHLPDECLAIGVEILADMYLHASIDAEEFAREKEVVIEEIRMYDDDPESVAGENLQRALFPGCQLGEPVAGSEKSLRAMKPGDLKRYIKAHYRPDNTIAVIAGAFDEAAALKALAPLAKLRPSKTREASPLTLAPVAGEVTARRDVKQAQLALGFRTFGLGDPRRYAATVLNGVLGQGMMSRLFQEVREKRGLSYDISSRMQFFDDAGIFSVTAGMDPSKREPALRTIDRELRRVCERRIGAEELRRTKDYLIGNFRLSHEKIVSKMFFHGATLLSYGRPVPIAEQVAALRAVTPEEVRETARAIFAPANRAVSWVLPKI